MIEVRRGEVEAILFWVGGCAFFACAPLFSAYVFHDFVPLIKGRTPLQAAVIGAQIGGLMMLIPAMVFRYGLSLRDRKGELEPRPMGPAFAALCGLMTGALTRLTGDLLLLQIACSAAALASSRLLWRTPR